MRGDGPDPAVVGVDDVFEQATFVAQRILELRDEGEKLDEIAVLYRSHYQSLELQMELTRRNYPVRDPLRRALLRAGAHQGRARLSEDRHEHARRAVVEADAEALSEGRREDGGRGVGCGSAQSTNPLDAFLRGVEVERPRRRRAR